MSRIPPSQQLAELARQLAEQAREGTEVEDLTHALVRLGARKLIQELLEAEVTELLGPGRYARREPGQETEDSSGIAAAPRHGPQLTSVSIFWHGPATSTSFPSH